MFKMYTSYKEGTGYSDKDKEKIAPLIDKAIDTFWGNYFLLPKLLYEKFSDLRLDLATYLIENKSAKPLLKDMNDIIKEAKGLFKIEELTLDTKELLNKYLSLHNQIEKKTTKDQSPNK